ncbi:MAG: ABC transporter substrate-binding protein [Rhodospirillaceae bacterium]|nr:ABC transporter substrate-binding protein [Rhodospirillaceae bacterium]MCA8932068.1 ABC transporter substrate-binding protein [Rhodospirillaceae bacterium]
MIRRFARILLVPLFLLALPAAASAQTPAQTPDGPSAPVVRLSDTLLDAMQNADQLGFDGRVDLLGPVLTDTFAFDQMARLVLGPEDFDGLDAATRARYVDAFTAMSIAVFAGRFDGYSGQQFQYGGEQEIRPGQVLVTTVLSAPERRSVNIEYLMRQFSGEWRVLDVFLDRRVSEVARQRSEFAAVYHRSGIEGLITEIEANTARQREGS